MWSPRSLVWTALAAAITLFVLAAPTTAVAPPGPDAFGYHVAVPGEPKAAPYQWTTLVGQTGITDSTPGCDDSCPKQVNLGFDYEFYGTQYDKYYVSDNGFIMFGGTQGATDWFPNPIPTAPSMWAPTNFIAGVWADLKPCPSGKVLTKTSGPAGNKVHTVEFNDWRRFSGCGKGATFQIKLYEAEPCFDIIYNDLGTGFTMQQGVQGTVDDVTDGIRTYYGSSSSFTGKLKTYSYCIPGSVTAVDDVASTLEDVSLLIDVLANDEESKGDTLSIQSVSNPPLGTAVIEGTKLKYTPDANVNTAGTPDSFSYQVRNGWGVIDTGTVTVSITPVNDKPTIPAPASTPTGTEDTVFPATPWLAAVPGPADEAGQQLTYSVSHGAAGFFAVGPTVAPDGKLSFTPAPDQCGTVPLSVQVQDDGGTTNGGEDTSATAIYPIHVTCTPDAPVAVDDALTALAWAGATPLTSTLDVLGNDFDVDGEALTITTFSPPALGAAATDGPAQFLKLTPPPAWTGILSMDYEATDPTGLADSASIEVVVHCADLVVVGEQATLAEDTAISGSLVANDAILTSTWSIQALVPPAHGDLQITPTGVYTYTPHADYFGADSFVYRVFDDGFCHMDGTVDILVTGVQDPPQAILDEATMFEDGAPIFLDVLANDLYAPDAPETLTRTSFTPPTYGKVDVVKDKLRYTPPTNWHGLDTFTYEVSDGSLSAIGNVQILVLAVNDPPVAVEDRIRLTSGTKDVDPAFSVLLNDVDIEGQPLTARLHTPAKHGTVILKPDGSFQYTSPPGFQGPDFFLYQAHDGLDFSAAAIVHLAIGPATPPLADFEPLVPRVAVGIGLPFSDRSQDDGPIVAWHWQFGDGQKSDLQHPSHVYGAPGRYDVVLTVTDEDGLSAKTTRAVEIIVAYPTEDGGSYDGPRPVADAGDDRTVAPGMEVTLGGEPRADHVYHWRQIAGDPVVLTGASTANPTLVAPPLDGLPFAQYAWELVVYDGRLPSHPDLVEVMVETPAPLGDVSVEVGGARKALAGSDFTLVGVTRGFDEGHVTLQWVQTAGPNVAAILPGGTVRIPAPDAPGATLSFIFRATQGERTAETSWAVKIVDELPEQGFQFAASGTAVSFASAFDPTLPHRWDFGDGARSAKPDPQHAFPGSGVYRVSLEVLTADGPAVYEENLVIGAPLASASVTSGSSLLWLGMGLVTLVTAMVFATWATFFRRPPTP